MDFTKIATVLIACLVVLVANSAIAAAPTKVDKTFIVTATAVAVQKIDAANAARDEVEAKRQEAIAAVAAYNQARENEVVAREALWEALRAGAQVYFSVLDVHLKEILPPPIEIGEPAAPPVDPGPADDEEADEAILQALRRNEVISVPVPAIVPARR